MTEHFVRWKSICKSIFSPMSSFADSSFSIITTCACRAFNTNRFIDTWFKCTTDSHQQKVKTKIFLFFFQSLREMNRSKKLCINGRSLASNNSLRKLINLPYILLPLSLSFAFYAIGFYIQCIYTVQPIAWSRRAGNKENDRYDIMCVCICFWVSFHFHYLPCVELRYF